MRSHGSERRHDKVWIDALTAAGSRARAREKFVELTDLPAARNVTLTALILPQPVPTKKSAGALADDGSASFAAKRGAPFDGCGETSFLALREYTGATTSAVVCPGFPDRASERAGPGYKTRVPDNSHKISSCADYIAQE